MFGGMNRHFAAAIAAGAALTVALAGPSAALACNGGTSAVNVYKECVPNGGGGGSTAGPSTGAKGTGSHSNSTAPPVSSQTQKALSNAGKDKKDLSYLVKSFGLRRHLASSNAGHQAAAPSAVGSAFDLGSGPTALLIVLAGAAALLLGGSFWRSRRRV